MLERAGTGIGRRCNLPHRIRLGVGAGKRLLGDDIPQVELLTVSFQTYDNGERGGYRTLINASEGCLHPLPESQILIHGSSFTESFIVDRHIFRFLQGAANQRCHVVHRDIHFSAVTVLELRGNNQISPSNLVRTASSVVDVGYSNKCVRKSFFLLRRD